MKILHVVNYYHEGFGYQENYLPKFQQRSGHEVLVLASDYYFPVPNYNDTMRHSMGDRCVGYGEFFDDNLKVVRTKSWFGSIRRPGLIYFPVGRVLAEYKPEIVHVHGATNLTIPVLCLLQKKYKYKIFVDSHQDDSVSNYTDSPVDKLYYGVWRLLYHSFGLIKKIALFLPITKNAGEWLSKRLHISEDQMFLSPLGVDLGTMSYDKGSEVQFRSEHGIGDKLVVVNAGKQYPEKRIEWIIDVVKTARNLGANAFLVLIGNADKKYDAVLRGRLAEIEGHYLRLPFLDREELSRVYSAADIGIWPGVPSITIQEAMACGVAMILPDDNIVGQFVKNNGLHESENIMKAAAFIHAMSMDPVKLDRLRNESVSVVKKYDWHSVSDELIRLYEKSIN